MLKACWDCIAPANPREHHAYGSTDAGSRVTTRVEGYGNGIVRPANGYQSAPPWPRASRADERMYLLPKPPAAGDKILVSGSITDSPRMIALSLVTGGSQPDYGNIACQIEIRFPASGDDRTTVKIVKDGVEIFKDEPTESIPSDQLFPNSNFTFEFLITVKDYGSGEHQIDINLAGNFLEDMTLQHTLSDIRYLTLHGDIARVDKLEFQFQS